MTNVTNKEFSQAYKIVILYHVLPQLNPNIDGMVKALLAYKKLNAKAVGPDECKQIVKDAGFNIQDQVSKA